MASLNLSLADRAAQPDVTNAVAEAVTAFQEENVRPTRIHTGCAGPVEVPAADAGPGSAAPMAEDSPTKDSKATASSGSAELAAAPTAEPPVEATEIPDVSRPVLWMVGAGACSSAQWQDCPQPFANVLETQMVEAVPVARYVFYGNLETGPVSFVHDFRDMTQINESTGQRKRIRRVQEIDAALPRRGSSGRPMPVGRATGIASGIAGARLMTRKLT